MVGSSAPINRYLKWRCVSSVFLKRARPWAKERWWRWRERGGWAQWWVFLVFLMGWCQQKMGIQQVIMGQWGFTWQQWGLHQQECGVDQQDQCWSSNNSDFTRNNWILLNNGADFIYPISWVLTRKNGFRGLNRRQWGNMLEWQGMSQSWGLILTAKTGRVGWLMLSRGERLISWSGVACVACHIFSCGIQGSHSLDWNGVIVYLGMSTSLITMFLVTLGAWHGCARGAAYW